MRRNLVHDENLFLFSVFIVVLLIFQKKSELLHCVFSSGRLKSNKIVNKNVIG